jgi:hypothetical protein
MFPFFYGGIAFVAVFFRVELFAVKLAVFVPARRRFLFPLCYVEDAAARTWTCISFLHHITYPRCTKIVF